MVLVREYLWTSDGCDATRTRSRDEVSMNQNGEGSSARRQSMVLEIRCYSRPRRRLVGRAARGQEAEANAASDTAGSARRNGSAPGCHVRRHSAK